MLNKNIEHGIDIFIDLEKRFPDFYEIKNNLAIAYAAQGNKKKSLEMKRQIETMPHIARKPIADVNLP